MGYIYKVAVPHGRWPTARALDAALEKRAGVRILVRSDRADDAFGTAPDESLAVLVDDCPHILDSRDYVFDPDEDIFELRDIMRDAGMDIARLEGAHIFSITAYRDERDWRVAGALMKALVREFGGYGMDFQTNAAGTFDWADGLDEMLAAGRKAYLALEADIASRQQENVSEHELRRRAFDRLSELFGNRGVVPGRRHTDI